MRTLSGSDTDPLDETANERLKRSFGSWMWGGVIAATLLHFGAIAFFPPLTAEDWRIESRETVVFDVPPDIDIPPAPEPVQRPATPIITETLVEDDVTIPSTSWEDNRPEELPPPSTDPGFDPAAAPFAVPHTVRPEIRNLREVERALEREYPSALRDAGVGGVVRVHFFIDEDGGVRNRVIDEGSGHVLLDQAAMRVAEVLEFTPAMNRDERVAVWVSVPIRFTTRR